MPAVFLRYPAVVALLFGAITATGFAPWQLWPLTLVGLAALVGLVHAAATLRRAAWIGWCWGFGHFTVNSNWLQHAFDFQDKMPPALGYVAVAGAALYLAVFPMLAAGATWRLGRRDRLDEGFALAFAAAWIASEYLRATLFTGYPWDPIAVIWLPMIGVARLSAWIGTYALSGVTVLIAAALLLAIRRRWHLAAKLTPLLIFAGFSSVSHLRAPEPDAPLLRVVQPNIGQDARGQDDQERMLAALSRWSGRPGPRPRLVLWPEGVMRDYLESGYPRWIYDGTSPLFNRWRLAQLLGPRDVLLTGHTPLRFDAAGDVVGAANAVFAIDSRARIVGRYDKAHLVPYGEYLPMPWLLRPLGLARLVPGDLDFDDGPGPRTLAIPGFGAIGVQICYEIIFSGRIVDPAHRPAMIFNPSTDAWFGRWGPPQHLAQARMRAIEEGLPVVRSTPTGISAVIAADGTLLASVPHERAGAIEVPMPRALPPTLFSQLGHWATLIVALGLVAGTIAIRRRRR